MTGEVFLGLSVGCARCHDHKFDPILQKDYYRLQAFFTPIMPRDDLSVASAEETAAYQAKLRGLGEGDGRGSGEARRDRGADPEKEDADAISKFPADVKALFAKPEGERTPLEAAALRRWRSGS